MSVKNKVAKTQLYCLMVWYIDFMYIDKHFVKGYKTKKHILAFFLLIVNAFIVWNISLKMPEISIMFPDGHFVYENSVEAKFEANNEVPEVETNPKKAIVKKVASETGVDWKILYGIFQKETQEDCDRMGDWQMDKPSIGCYQISLHYHPEVKMSQASNLEWSTRWTADRLKKDYESTGSWDMAIMKHNGDPNNPKVQQYLKDVKANIEKL